ncbi:MAG: MFS transporter [Leifsonia sp.]
MVLIAFLDSAGTGVYLAGASLFFIQFKGFTVAEVGIGLTMSGIASLLSKVPIGLLADRYGPRGVLVSLTVLRGVGFACMAGVSNVAGYVCVSIALGVLEGPVSPLTQSVVSSVVDDRSRIRTLALIRTARNVGFSIGGLATSGLVLVGSDWALASIMLLNAGSFFVAAAMLSRVRLLRPVTISRKPSAISVMRTMRDGPYIALAALCGVLAIHSSVLFVAIPAWSLSPLHIDAAMVPLLVAVNTVLAVVLQIPLSAIAESPQGAARALRIAAAALASMCACLGLMIFLPTDYALVGMMVAIGLLTVGEVAQAAGGWELSYRYSEKDSRVLYLATFSLGDALQKIVAPALLTVAVIPASWLGWAALGGVILACLPLLSVVLRRLELRHSGSFRQQKADDPSQTTA